MYKILMKSVPECDYCRKDRVEKQAKYDCRTIYGHWAYLCREHYFLYGSGGLGMGLGQKIINVGG